MRRKLELVSFPAVLYAVLARARKLLGCVRAPAQLLRLVLSFFRVASSWLSSRGSSRPILPTAQQSHGQAEDTESLQDLMTSLNTVCASHVPDSHIPEAVPDIGSMRDPAAATSTSIATSSDDNHSHSNSHRNGGIMVPSSPCTSGHPGSSSHNVAAPAASSHSLVSQATSTPNLPATALTSIRPAGPRSRSFASRALDGRPSSSGAPHQPSVTLTVVRRVLLINFSLSNVYCYSPTIDPLMETVLALSLPPTSRMLLRRVKSIRVISTSKL
jgi:hypothetical protein